jgi:hypothetical protein
MSNLLKKIFNFRTLVRSLSVSAVAAGAATALYFTQPTEVEVQTAELSSAVPELSEFVYRVMDTCGAGGSPGRKFIQSEQIARVAEQIFTDRLHREAFVLLICIESKFRTEAVSPVGAVGLTQLMPKYAADFAEICKSGQVVEAELYIPEINLRLGACYFRHLINLQGGNITLALASYNAGLNSVTVKRMKQLSLGTAETTGYIAKFSILRDHLAQVAARDTPTFTGPPELIVTP